MHRVDPDRGRAERAGAAAELGQIGEIAHAPVARAAQAVDLGRQPPAARAGLERRRQVASRRRHRNADADRQPPDIEAQPVIAGGQRVRQLEQRLIGPSVKRDRVAAPCRRAAILEIALPVDRAAVRRQPHGQRRRLGGDDLERIEAQRRRVLRLDDRGDGAVGLRRQAERGDEPRQRLRPRFVRHAERIDMARRDAEQLGDPLERPGVTHLPPLIPAPSPDPGLRPPASPACRCRRRG